jgi:phospholipid transport system substrate-binding protein
MNKTEPARSSVFTLCRRIASGAIIAAVFAFGLSTGGVRAAKFESADSQAAGSFIVALSERIAAASTSADTQSQTSRLLEAAQLLRESIDVKATGRFVLGPYRTKASAAQRAAFDALISDLLLRNYLGHFAAAPGTRLELLSARAINGSDTLVETGFSGGDTQEAAVWRVRKTDAGFRIVDIAVDGMSLAITQRRAFTSRAGIEGVDAALVALEQDLTAPGPVLVAGKDLAGVHRSVLASFFGSAKQGTVGLALAGLK